MRAVLYLRLSDASDDASTSIARQEQDLRDLAEREGWDVVRVLADDGISGRKVRANATEALRMLRDGEAEVLATWKLDRWSRQGLAAVGDLVRALDETPGALFVALRDGLRSDAQTWRMIAGVLSETARMEAENTATRIRSSIAYLRTAGRFPGGTVPFGYRTVERQGGGRTLVPDAFEASIVREFSDRILADESQSSLLDALVARGVATTRSPWRLAHMRGEPTDGLDRGSWSYAGLASVWTGESVIGRMARNTGTRKSPRWEVVRGDDGMPLQAFPAILDGPTAERLRTRLRDPRRDGERRPQRPRRARLLSGLIYCAECQQRLWVTTSGGRTVYTCARRAGRCTGPNMKAENAERAVVDRFLGVAGSWPEVARVETASAPEAAAALAEVETAIREASAELAADGADGVAIVARVESLKVRRAELQAVPSAVSVELVPTGRTLAEAWEVLGNDERRTLLGYALDHVSLSLTDVPGRTGYHPERLGFHWNDPEASRSA